MNTEPRYDLAVCTDCLLLLVNDDTSGIERCSTPGGEADYREAVAIYTGGLHVFPSSWPDHDWTDDDVYAGRDCEPRFSHSQCGTCRTSLGGDRHPMAAFPIGGVQ